MKKILSFLMALVMLTSTLVFCFAETEIKVDVRLEEKEDGFVDMVFSIPENADLAEFSFNVYYHSAAIVVDGDDEVSFESNLSKEEEKKVSWQNETDYQNLDSSYGEYPCCFVSGYTKEGEGLNKGGDLFTLTFKLIDGIPDESYVFNIETNFITNAKGDFYTDAYVPQTIGYDVKDAAILSYYVNYTEYVPEVSLEIIDEVSKLAWDYSPTVHREFYDIANDMLFPGESSFSGSNGGRVYSQGFAPAYKYVSEVKVYIRVYGVSHGTDYLTIQIRNSYHDINTVYSNNYAVSATGDRWIGGATAESNGAAKRVALNVNQTYHLAFSYCYPGVAGTASGLVADNVNNSYPLYFTGENQHDSWTKLNGCNAFDINYDSDMNNFDLYVSNMGSSFDVDDEANFNNATTYYNRIKNNAYQWNVINSTIRNNYSSASSAISSAKTKINNFKTAVTNINSGGITISDDKAINDALTAYNNLSTAQRNYSGVSTSKSTLDGYRTTCTNLINGKNAVQTAISNIGTPVTWSKKSTVEEARTAYDKLSQDQKNNVNNYSTLTTAEATIESMRVAANNFKAAAVAIGAVDYDSNSKALIDAARDAYTALEAFNDSTLTSTNWATEHLAILQAAEAEYARLESEVTQFRQAMSNMQPGDVDAANALKAAYEGFTEGQKAAVSAEYETLMALGVRDLIDACYPVDLDKIEEIELARTSFDNLSDELKVLIGEEYVNKLIAAEELYDEILAKIDALEEEIALIEKPYEIDDADAIYAAKEKYDALTPLQQEAVENRQDLLDAIDALLEAENKIQEVEDLIDAIGKVSYGKLLDIEAAREAYENLSDDQKAQVSNLDVLEAAEEIITIIEEGCFGDINLDDNVDIMDAIFILQVGITKIPVASLELKQIILGDVDGNGKFDPQDALLVLHYLTNKIYYFPVEEVYWE